MKDEQVFGAAMIGCLSRAATVHLYLLPICCGASLGLVSPVFGPSAIFLASSFHEMPLYPSRIYMYSKKAESTQHDGLTVAHNRYTRCAAVHDTILHTSHHKTGNG